MMEAKYKLKIGEEKKAPFVLRTGQNEYATGMATTGNNVRKRDSREATAKELIEEMKREWQIKGGKPSRSRDEEFNQNSKQCCLISKTTNKTTKRARIATIVGQRIIDGKSDPFYDEKTRKKGGNNDQKNHTFNGYCLFWVKIFLCIFIFYFESGV